LTRNARKLRRESVEKRVSVFVIRRCSRSFQDAGETSLERVRYASVLLRRYGRRIVNPAWAHFCRFDGATERPFSVLAVSNVTQILIVR
jgi:hypothetical protein